MRISKSACTLAKKKYYHNRVKLDLPRTNVFTEEDTLDAKSKTRILELKRSKFIPRTKSVKENSFL